MGAKEKSVEREQARARLAARMERRQASASGDEASSKAAAEYVEGTLRPSGQIKPNVYQTYQIEGISPLGANEPFFVKKKAEASRSRVIVRILVVAVLLALLCLAIRWLLAPPEGFDSELGDSQQPTAEEAQPDSSAELAIDQEALSSIMGDDLAMQMAVLATADPDLRWIASHPDELSVDGAKAQRKLLQLATVEPAAISFVRDYPDLYPDESADASELLGEDVDIPLLMQWDQKWGYTVYSGAAFGQTGCCPTCLAMVYQGLTRKTDMSPYDMGKLARENGFMSPYSGTDAQFLLTCGAQLGLSVSQISVNEEALKQSLSNGDIVISNVGPGDFTEGGHFIVLVGLDEDGCIIVNDPYSAKKSQQAWTASEIIDQTKALYAFER